MNCEHWSHIEVVYLETSTLVRWSLDTLSDSPVSFSWSSRMVTDLDLPSISTVSILAVVMGIVRWALAAFLHSTVGNWLFRGGSAERYLAWSIFFANVQCDRLPILLMHLPRCIFHVWWFHSLLFRLCTTCNNWSKIFEFEEDVGFLYPAWAPIDGGCTFSVAWFQVKSFASRGSRLLGEKRPTAIFTNGKRHWQLTWLWRALSK